MGRFAMLLVQTFLIVLAYSIADQTARIGCIVSDRTT